MRSCQCSNLSSAGTKKPSGHDLGDWTIVDQLKFRKRKIALIVLAICCFEFRQLFGEEMLGHVSPSPSRIDLPHEPAPTPFRLVVGDLVGGLPPPRIPAWGALGRPRALH